MRPWMIPAVFLVGCSNFTNEVYWFELTTDPDATESTTTVQHNFADAQPIVDDVEVDEGVPVTTTTRETSPDGFYVHVRRGADGVVFVNFLEQVLTGGVDGGVLTADWEDSASQTVTTTFDSLYAGDSTTSSSQTWTLTLEDDESLGGTFETLVTTSVAYSETDEWDPVETSVLLSVIPAASWLEGTDPKVFVSNSPDLADCQASPCTLSAEVSTLQRFTVAAFPAGSGGYEYFDVVQDFDQAAGPE